MKTIFFILLVITTQIANAEQICQQQWQVPATTPNSNFVDNLDGTVTDTNTGLMWQKCQLGLSGDICETGSVVTFTWEEALDEASLNDYSGYTDWRVPNIKELASIVEYQCNTPAINLNIFPNTTTSLNHASTGFASSTIVNSQAQTTFYINTTLGTILRSSRLSSFTFLVRLVRSD